MEEGEVLRTSPRGKNTKVKLRRWLLSRENAAPFNF